MVLFHLPGALYLFYLNFPVTDSYSWARVHSAETWGSIDLHRSYGQVRIDYWGNPLGGLVIWMTLGTGPEAMKIYKGILKALGFGGVFPSLLQDSASSHRSSARWSLFSSKARNFFNSWSSKSTSTTMTLSSSKDETPSPTSISHVLCDQSAIPRPAFSKPGTWFSKVKTILDQSSRMGSAVELKQTNEFEVPQKREENV